MEEKFELLNFLKIIKERKTIVLIGTLLCLLFARLATDYLPPVYESSVQMLISQGQVKSKDEPMVESYQAILLSERLATTFSQILTSRTLAERVAGRMQLQISPEELQKKVDAEVVKDTQLVKLTVTDTKPSFAKRLADNYAAEFIKMADEVLPSSALVNIRVVDKAAVPRTPIWPKPIVNLVEALVVGLSLSTGLAFVLGMLDVTVKETEEIEQLISLPLLARIPNIKNPLLLGNEETSTAEVYRTLRTNLQYINFDQSTRTLIISSPSLNEGKTTVSHNLAVVFAQAGYNILLINGDLRNPKLNRLLNKSGESGLSNVLIGISDVESVIQDTEIDRLSFVASGPTPPNPPDLLNSDRMDNLLEYVSRDFDLVIIDCPPILAVADTPILAVKVDAVLMVSNFGRTKKSDMLAAKDMLDKVGARIIGFVINSAETTNDSRFDYYHRKPDALQKAA